MKYRFPRGRIAACAVFAVLSGALTLAGCGGSSGDRTRSTTTPTPIPTPTPSTTPVTGLAVTSNVTAQSGWNVAVPSYVQPNKKWTFLVYMNGANNLEQYGTLNVNQMEQIGSDSNLNIVVQYKRIAGNQIQDAASDGSDDDTSNGNWTNTRRYFVTRDNDSQTINSQLVSQRDNLDMGDWHNLQDFVQWGLKTFPADHYCLVVWNHGAGWRSVKIDKTRGVSYDDVTGNHIDTIQMPEAIDMGSGRKWDILTIDCSLMQMLEVAYEVRDKALYINGSEESPPGAGYPYNLFLGNLASKMAAGTTPSASDFAQDIAQQTINSYGPDSNITQSVLDTSKVAAIVPAVDKLGQVLSAKQSQYRTQIITARGDTENYAYSYYLDLRDFTSLLISPRRKGVSGITDSNIKSAVGSVQSTLNAAIIKNVHGTQHSHSNGLSIFLPSPTTYSDIDIEQANGFGQRYSTLQFAKDAPNWVNFLKNGPL